MTSRDAPAGTKSGFCLRRGIPAALYGRMNRRADKSPCNNPLSQPFYDPKSGLHATHGGIRFNPLWRHYLKQAGRVRIRRVVIAAPAPLVVYAPTGVQSCAIECRWWGVYRYLCNGTSTGALGHCLFCNSQQYWCRRTYNENICCRNWGFRDLFLFPC